MSTQITPLTDGPLKVDGDFKITKQDGTIIESKETAYLCRCGKSSTKPFCDGSHKKEGFKAE